MFDISVIQQNWPLFWSGLLVTLFYSAISIAAGLVIGLIIGLIQLTGSRALSLVGRVYVEIFRNIPLLVILLWIYYAFPIFAGLAVTKFWAGFAGLSLYAGPSTPKFCAPAFSRSTRASPMPLPRSA